MLAMRNQIYFIVSVIFHIFVLFVLIFSFDFSSTLPVFENTNKNDVISAVVLGDTAKSKIITEQPASKPEQRIVKEEPKPIEPKEQPNQQLAQQLQAQKDAIALKIMQKKKLAQQKALEMKKQKDLFAKDLLTDIKKQHDIKKKLKQNQLKSQFETMLRKQAEKSLREQLLNEEIKLKGTQSRQAQGEVNKYKALILQAISEHWIIPIQANKTLYCELMIRVAPGGLVLDVQITKSSGDPSLDSSARAAVLKASPLPVPNDASAFEAFRQFVLKVKPENVLGNGGMASSR